MSKKLGSRRESSLHSDLKKWYTRVGDKIEANVDGYIIDIARGDLLIEIQTANFSAIKPKLLRLLENHRVRIVYPIPQIKWIVHRSDVTGEMYGRRKSSRKGRLTDVFGELIRVPDLFSKGSLSIEVLMVEVEEVWHHDGRGSWRRKGASIEDRRLVRVFESINFESAPDFLKLLPEGLSNPYSNMDLAKGLGVPVSQSQKITYALRRMGAIKTVGKNRNSLLFEPLCEFRA